MPKKFLLISILLLSLTTLTGCSLSLTGTGSSAKNSAGIFKSYDFGERWQASNQIKDSNKNINNLNIRKIVIDNNDHTKIYLAAESNGIWYSENAGENWQNILSKGTAYDLALDPKNSGIVFASFGNQVNKTIDLGKNWQQLYLETRVNVLISAIAIDPNDNLVLYLGSSNGEIYKTIDGGKSWQLIKKIDSDKDVIKKILVNPKNSKIVYIATATTGIYKSTDAGKQWQNLKNNYSELKDSNKQKLFPKSEIFYDLVLDLTQNDGLLYASQYGLIKSLDGGKTWQEIKLLTPAGSPGARINTLALNPKDNQQIYYATNSVLYRSFDNGLTWLSNSLPSTRFASTLIVDPFTPNVLYFGLMDKARGK